MTQLSYGPFISRAQAKEQGLKRYYTGKACKHGHITVRRTACASCDTCARVVLNRHDKKRYWTNPEFRARRLRDSKNCRINNPERYAMHRTNWKNKQDPEKLLKRNMETLQIRRETRPHLRIRESLSGRMRTALLEKAGSFENYLGCNFDVAIAHLQSLFQPGMTWANHGVHGWHIDHIRPCASFDLTDPEQQKQCFHYTNLQPLWALDNIRKGDKWEAVAA